MTKISTKMLMMIHKLHLSKDKILLNHKTLWYLLWTLNQIWRRMMMKTKSQRQTLKHLWLARLIWSRTMLVRLKLLRMKMRIASTCCLIDYSSSSEQRKSLSTQFLPVTFSDLWTFWSWENKSNWCHTFLEMIQMLSTVSWTMFTKRACLKYSTNFSTF